MKNSKNMESTYLTEQKSILGLFRKTKILGLGRAHKFRKQRNKIVKNLTYKYFNSFLRATRIFY